MSHAGEVSPEDAYAALREDPDALLVDVRTEAEWSYVGLPDLSGLGKRVLTIEWQTFPSGDRNEAFMEQLRACVGAEEASLYFLCRSGVRSAAAADLATANGLGPAYNVRDGFEGPHDAEGHRGAAGWKAAGLPWRQG